MASPATSIPDSQLGLTSDEVRTLRYHQQAAISQGGGSSRAASQASSQGRLLIDAGSLASLANYFDRLMYSIQARWTSLYQQTQNATTQQYDRAGHAIEMADAEIARFHDILRQIDELQNEFAKIKRIGEIVKGFRARVEALDRRV
ncbi:hypothetical protein FKW77_007821 [Venturia effusa]|uniref:Biogenesis of lysosome-related organelles complex 1 subunit CNL1 n=1 Tax=Venturia effusa TaxID=50376 RepID=A0A517L3S4_9PEZI|nr:hypothetical protein FKW77_007821 [Venturia effusa]